MREHPVVDAVIKKGDLFLVNFKHRIEDSPDGTTVYTENMCSVGRLTEIDYPYFKIIIDDCPYSEWYHRKYVCYLPEKQVKLEYTDLLARAVQVPIVFRDNAQEIHDSLGGHIGLETNAPPKNHLDLLIICSDTPNLSGDYAGYRINAEERTSEIYCNTEQQRIARLDRDYELDDLDILLSKFHSMGRILEMHHKNCMICDRISPRNFGSIMNSRDDYVCNLCIEETGIQCGFCNEVERLHEFTLSFHSLFPTDLARSSVGVYCNKCLRDHFFHCENCNTWKVSTGTDYSESMRIDGERKCGKCSDTIIRNVSEMPIRAFSPRYFKTSKSNKLIKYKEHAGIELELIRDDGEYYDNDGDLRGLPVGWYWGSDTSISSEEYGVELRTAAPVNGDELHFNIADIVRYVKNNRMWHDSSCGMHCHVDARDLGYIQLKRILIIMLRMERFLYQSMPVHRMQRRYSRPLPRMNLHLMIEKIKAIRSMKDFAKLWYEDISSSYMTTEKYNESRYRGLNLHSRFFFGSVEFRYFPVQISDSFISNWLKFCLAVVHKSKRILPKDFEDANVILGLEDYLDILGEKELYQFFLDQRDYYRMNNNEEVQRYFNER